MSEPFIAEIRIFAGNFAPRNWAFCNGQLLQIAQNTALFALIGTIYGGDGRTTFALPNLQARFPLHPGTGPGLTLRRLGEAGGTATVTLTESQMPNHTHPMGVHAGDPADLQVPSTATSLAFSSINAYHTNSTQNLEALATEALPTTGGSQPHNNRQPFLGLNFIIALAGIFPSRN